MLDHQDRAPRSTPLKDVFISPTLITDLADRSPTDLENLDDRLRSRLLGSVVVEMKSPDECLRFEILKSQLICRALAILASTSLKKTLEFITQTVSYSARDLHSAVNHLVARNQLSGHPVTIEIAAPYAI